jgi:hypothetical protein
MKRFKTMAFTLLFVAGSVVYAQGPGQGGRQMRSATDRAKAETEQMTQTLALDQAQVVKVQEINLKFAKQDSVRFAEMRAGGQQMDREKMMETMRANQEAKSKELNEVLTDDQKAKYTKFLEERRQRGFGGGQGNRQGPRNGQQ